MRYFDFFVKSDDLVCDKFGRFLRQKWWPMASGINVVDLYDKSSEVRQKFWTETEVAVTLRRLFNFIDLH